MPTGAQDVKTAIQTPPSPSLRSEEEGLGCPKGEKPGTASSCGVTGRPGPTHSLVLTEPSFRGTLREVGCELSEKEGGHR